MGMEAAVETILTFTLISSVVTLAVENVKGALENEGLYDEVMLGIGITICVVFDVQLIEAISGKVSALQVGPYVDYLIGGSAMAGGGARLLRRLNRNVSSVKKAAG
jgi:hypothetical protein